MRTIYFVRHGEPETGTKERICLGRKDLELSEEGNAQAGALGAEFGMKYGARGSAEGGVRIFSSPLRRCAQTAERIAQGIYGASTDVVKEQAVTIVPDFAEVDTGIWDGLTFREIKEKYPEEYEERGKHLGTYVIPGGESLEQAGERFFAALRVALEESEDLGFSEEDVMIVGHAGVFQAMLCKMTGRSVDEAKEFKIPYAGVMEWKELVSAERIRQIWETCEVEERVIRHMKKVAMVALGLALDGKARADGEMENVHPETVYYAALLHDIMRKCGRTHPVEAADFLETQFGDGYAELADIIRVHHDPQVYRPGEPVSDAELLYYADKLVREDQIVTLEERFGASLAKCRTPQALANHQMRWDAARGIEEKCRR